MDVDTIPVEPALKDTAVVRVKSKHGSVSSHVSDNSSLLRNSFELNFKEGTGVCLETKQILLGKDTPYLSVVKKLNDVYLLLE